MNAAIGIYDTHDIAIDAVRELKDAGYPVSQLSVMGLMETEVIDDQMHVMPKNPLKTAGIGLGTVAGTTLGILTGIGVFAIPGVGFLFGAGAVVGAIAGFDIGLVGGGIATALASAGVTDDAAKKYHDVLADGKFLVLAQGTPEEVDRARSLLHTQGNHLELMTH